jgi:hypothetical protein
VPKIDTLAEKRERPFSSLGEPPPLTHDRSKLIGQQRAERTALCGGDGLGSPQ